MIPGMFHVDANSLHAAGLFNSRVGTRITFVLVVASWKTMRLMMQVMGIYIIHIYEYTVKPLPVP